MVCNYREMFKFYFSNFNTNLAYSRFARMTQENDADAPQDFISVDRLLQSVV
jgi:hypothetical protein